MNRTRGANPKSAKRSKGRVPSQTQQGGSPGKGPSPLMTEVAFKTLILGALEGLHGKLGSVGYPVDVLSWDPLKGEGRLRVNARYVVTTPSPTLHNPGETRLTHANRTFCVHRRSPYPCSGSRCERPARRASRRLPKCLCCTGAYASTLPKLWCVCGLR